MTDVGNGHPTLDDPQGEQSDNASEDLKSFEEEAPEDLKEYTTDAQVIDKIRNTFFDWSVVLDYADTSAWFGTFFLAFMVFHKKSSNETKTPDIEDGKRSKIMRMKDKGLAMLMDLCILLGATLIQPLLYAFFLWAILDNLFELGDSVQYEVFCPFGGEKGAPPVEQCFYFCLLAVYFLQMVSEIRNTFEFRGHIKLDSGELAQIKAVLNHKIQHPDDEQDMPEFVALHRGLSLLIGKYPWSVISDQALHVFGICVLTSTSMIAMFFQKGVGQMVLNATAVFFLEQVDDAYKSIMVKRHKERLVTKLQTLDWDDYNKKEAEKEFKDVNDTKFHIPIQVHVTSYLTYFCCLAVIGLIFFLAVQTGRGCKPDESPKNLFD